MIVIEATARLARPAIIDGPLHLDALLSARHPAMHTRDQTLTRKGGRIRVAPLDLCTARVGNLWVWCASAWIPPAPTGAVAMVKRRDGIDYQMTSRTVYPSVGPMRDRLMRQATVTGDLQWLAAVPNGRGYKELRRICRRVDQIGSWRKSGYGVVGEWEFREVDRPATDCLAMGSISQRTLPVEMFASNAQAERISVIPPYWAGAEAREAYSPGAKGTLCNQITIT